MNQNLLNVEEISEVLNVPHSWIYARTREKGAGSIPCIKVGKYVRFELEKVMDWLKEQNEAK
jgi:excisionase family DNA binding protein